MIDSGTDGITKIIYIEKSILREDPVHGAVASRQHRVSLVALA